MRRARLGWLVAIACGAPATAGAQILDGWLVSGTNTLRVDHYDASGDLSSSPYSRLGTFSYDDFSLLAVSKPTPYSQRRVTVTGVLNDSPYRSSYQGFVPERINLMAESGEHRWAWRVELGDLFAFTTLRTLQRSLKGASLELQPEGTPFARQSIVLFAGAAARDGWREPSWSEDNTLGASWLVETARFGRWNANLLRGSRETAGSGADLEQTVASLAAEKVFALGGAWKLRVEGEAGRMQGDREGGIAGEDEVSDAGAFAQVSVFDACFNARVRAERSGRDYRPFGAVTSPDRRSLEAYATWTLPHGVTLSGRMQGYTDGFEGANPTDTRVFGANAAGAWAPFRLSGSLDGFVQETEDELGLQDTRLTQLSLDLSRPFGGFIGRLGAAYTDSEDRIDDTRSYRTTQASISAIVPFLLGGLRGTASPGIRYRNTTGANAIREWQPTLALVLTGGAHQLTASLGRQDQEPRVGAFTEIATVNAAIDYRYKFGQHTFGVDASLFDRRPAPGEKTEAWRIGTFWSWQFEKPPAPARVGNAFRPYAAPPAPASLPRSAATLARLAPGQSIGDVRAALSAGGFGRGIAEPRMDVYEARLIDDVEHRQRLAIAHAGGLIERTAIVISLDGAADPARVYERARRALLDAFGAPAMTFDDGAWGPGFARDLAAGRFIRITEWATPYGIVRLGIPRRLDGVARIEIHHARGFGSPRDTIWGLDELR